MRDRRCPLRERRCLRPPTPPHDAPRSNHADYFVSAFVGLAATTALEKRGRQIGRTDGVMALSVFLWTVGFAGGGAVANVATGGLASAARQRGVLGVVGAACAAICLAGAPRQKPS